MKHLEHAVPFAELMPLIEDSLHQGLSVTLTVSGCSMRPLFSHKRDSVILSACDPYSLKRGDVPLYRRDDGQYVLHRIVRVSENGYTLTGDAQWELETDLPKDHVLAVMTGFVRKGKTVDCYDLGYRIYVALWLWLLPLRPYIVRAFRILHRNHN